jgi:hypothetical protein
MDTDTTRISQQQDVHPDAYSNFAKCQRLRKPQERHQDDPFRIVVALHRLDSARKDLDDAQKYLITEIGKLTKGLQKNFADFLRSGGVTAQQYCEWFDHGRYGVCKNAKPVPSLKHLRLIANNNSPERVLRRRRYDGAPEVA